MYCVNKINSCIIWKTYSKYYTNSHPLSIFTINKEIEKDEQIAYYYEYKNSYL